MLKITSLSHCHSKYSMRMLHFSFWSVRKTFISYCRLCGVRCTSNRYLWWSTMSELCPCRPVVSHTRHRGCHVPASRWHAVTFFLFAVVILLCRHLKNTSMSLETVSLWKYIIFGRCPPLLLQWRLNCCQFTDKKVKTKYCSDASDSERICGLTFFLLGRSV